MSTRCCVLLTAPDGARIYFYRHTDGYLSGAGMELVCIWTALHARSPTKPHGFPWIGEFAERLVLAHNKNGDRIWELTAGCHHDIDYFYRLDFPGFLGNVPNRGEDMDILPLRNLLRVRWVRGHGQELERVCEAVPLLTKKEFERDIVTNADRPEDEGER